MYKRQKEDSAVAVATAIDAGDERRARAKFHWQFLEHYPAAQDCAYQFLDCEANHGKMSIRDSVMRVLSQSGKANCHFL